MEVALLSNTTNEYPKEKFYPIKDSSDLLLRLTIGEAREFFWVEADIVSSEGLKIIRHLGVKHKLDSEFDAVQSGLVFYQHFLR